jgi:hypothetical protein
MSHVVPGWDIIAGAAKVLLTGLEGVSRGTNWDKTIAIDNDFHPAKNCKSRLAQCMIRSRAMYDGRLALPHQIGSQKNAFERRS